jgi:hypothetical protein
MGVGGGSGIAIDGDRSRFSGAIGFGSGGGLEATTGILGTEAFGAAGFGASFGTGGFGGATGGRATARVCEGRGGGGRKAGLRGGAWPLLGGALSSLFGIA